MRLQMILQVHLCPCDLFCDKIKGVLPKEEKGRWIWEKGGKPVVASGLCPRLPPVLSTESGPGTWVSLCPISLSDPVFFICKQ